MSALLVNNTIVVKSLSPLTNSQTSGVLTDAVLTFALNDEDGNPIFSGESMSHDGDGMYSGTKDLTGESITVGDKYILVVTCSNYPSEWSLELTAATRTFI